MKQVRFSEAEATPIRFGSTDRRLRLSQTLGVSAGLAVGSAVAASAAGFSLVAAVGVGLLALNLAPLAIGVVLTVFR